MSNLSELKRIAEEGGADVSNVKCNEDALALIGGSGSGSDEYDVEIVTSSGSADTVVGEVVKGNYSEIRQKLLSLTPFSARAITIFEYGDLSCYVYPFVMLSLETVSGEYPNATYADHIKVDISSLTTSVCAFWLPDGTLSNTLPV